MQSLLYLLHALLQASLFHEAISLIPVADPLKLVRFSFLLRVIRDQIVEHQQSLSIVITGLIVLFLLEGRVTLFFQMLNTAYFIRVGLVIYVYFL